jgi:hypothetical protein
MKTGLLTVLGVWAVALLLFLNLLMTVVEPIKAFAQKDTGQTGRYQISSWAASAGGQVHHHGYYILDTVTGKLFDKSLEAYKQGG